MAVHKTKLTIKKKAKRGKVQKKVPTTHKPANMGVEEWQRALRVQSAQSEKFIIKNKGEHPVFSEFSVKNISNKTHYRVVIRGNGPGVNFCTCPDYAVNTLGTCKHIEKVLLKIARTKKGREQLKEIYKPPYPEVYLKYGAKREIVFSPGKETRVGTMVKARKYFDSANILTEKGFKNFNSFLTYLRRKEPQFRCYDDALSFIAEKRDAAKREEIINEYSRKHKKNNGHAVRIKGIKVPLYSYQYDGAVFAARVGRSIIADEMGLGKTIQALSAVEMLKQFFPVEKVLVVCPTSLKYQWKMEIEKFCLRESVIVEGFATKRWDYYRTNSFYTIANYEQIYRDLEVVRQQQWDVIILDETQRIKNWKTLTSQSIKKLHSTYAIALTGTPLENRLEELHSIVAFIDRFKLGPLFRFLENHQITEDDTGKVTGYRNLSSINKTLKDILIRRNKKEVLTQLPERMDKHYFVGMTREQWAIHEENKSLVAQVVARWRKYRRLSESDQRKLMVGLQNMRMSCDSTYLVDKQSNHSPKLDELCAVINELELGESDKVVIFSQWHRMHELIVDMLRKNNIGHVFLHGGVPSKKRGDLVKKFENDPLTKVFLSTDAGGTGLNLQAASIVINCDLPWNPAVLEQRIGRVHRLGQHKPVRVINFVAEGTIEHGMLSVLAFKRSLSVNVLDGGDDVVMMGESRLNRFMKDVEKITAKIPPTHESGMESGLGSILPESSLIEGAGSEEKDGTVTQKHEQKTAAVNEELIRTICQQGAALLSGIANSLQQAHNGNGSGGNGRSSPVIEKDPRTGQASLKIPLPDEKTIQTTLSSIVSLLSGQK